MSRYDGMSREAMLDTVTGYTDDEATEKMADRTREVDEFMDLARDATVPEPTMPEPPAPPSIAILPIFYLRVNTNFINKTYMECVIFVFK